MSIRLEYWRAAPDEYRALMSLQTRLKAGIDRRLFDLIFLRVSQINGCAFCIDSHASEMRKTDDSGRRLDALVVWRDTPFFSAAERAALDWAERLTEIRNRGSLDAPYEALRPHFSERQIAVLTFAITVMNAMNRVAIGFGRRPELDAASSPPAEVRAERNNETR